MEWCPLCGREVGVLTDVEWRDGSEQLVRFLCIHCHSELFAEKRGLRPQSESTRASLPE